MIHMMRRLDRVVTSLMAVAEALLDAAVTRFGRVYVAAAATLISLVAAVFFAAVIPEVRQADGLAVISCCAAPPPSVMHAACRFPQHESMHCEVLRCVLCTCQNTMLMRAAGGVKGGAACGWACGARAAAAGQRGVQLLAMRLHATRQPRRPAS